MNRTTIGRRYAPLALLAAVQLLIIATVPSTAGRQLLAAGGTVANYGAGAAGGGTGSGTGSAGGGSGAGGSAGAAGQGTGSFGGTGGVGTGSAAGGTGGAGVGSAGTGGTGTGTGGGTGGTGGTGTGGAGVAGGDTSHCKAGREFDPAIAFFDPPCTPGSPGSTNTTGNGGATAPGVTASAVTIVDYNGDPGAEVDAIQQAEGLYESYANAQVVDRIYQSFLNKYLVLYGRQIHIITYQGQCTTVPPDTNCLIPEMDKLASQYHPYAVYWGNNTVCSQCYAELARDGVITFGGSGFSDAFANANAPYFYSSGESSTRIEQAFAGFYCRQLATSPVKFAGHENPAQDFNGKPRVLGVLSTNDPDNENTVKDVLVPALRSCGVTVSHFYYYAQDINTAAQQVAAGIAAMDTPTNPASVVLCLCDAVAPQFLFEGEKVNNYYPENVIASDQGMDTDSAAQSYESGLACPGGGNCEYDLAYGLGDNGNAQPQNNNDGTRIYAAGGGGALPVSANINENIALDYLEMGSLIENTGPDLTPANMLARSRALGSMGGGTSGHPLLQLAPGDTQWMQDTRVVYWSKTAASPYNGKPGAYIPIEGTRFNLGQFPAMAEPPIPNRPD